jgi:ferredoxin
VALEPQGLQLLLEALISRGYQPVGPTLRHGSLVYDRVSAISDLPRGWSDRQEGGSFRLYRREDDAFFGFGVGQQSWKQFLYPPRRLLWQADRDGHGFQIIPPQEETPRFAFIGVRACDLQALAVQDKVFLAGPFIDPDYQNRRQQAFILAVNCTRGCGTGFCASMGAGPRAGGGFDLGLTEIIGQDVHYFVTTVGSPRGGEMLALIPQRQARPDEAQAAAQAVARTPGQMGRTLDTRGIKELLYRNYENPRWDEVAARCLNCGNCALVCPTCFCHTVEDATDPAGNHAERQRRWDVCYTVDFTYLHGGSVRPSPRSRYRQWLTHKLATWLDQFGVLGCVGCGRCITWCPVAIDITAEAGAIRESEAAPAAKEK